MIALLLPLDLYHVSPDGNDANDGRTPKTAWKTVTKVNAERRLETDMTGKKRPAACAIGAREPAP